MAGWTSEPIRTFRRRQHLFPLPGIQLLFLIAVCDQVIISTELSELVEVMLLNIIWWRVISLTLWLFKLQVNEPQLLNEQKDRVLSILCGRGERKFTAGIESRFTSS